MTGLTEAAWENTLFESYGGAWKSCASASKTSTTASFDRPAAGKNHSLYVLLHGIIQHNLYHAGQIALLKKLVTQPLPGPEPNRPTFGAGEAMACARLLEWALEEDLGVGGDLTSLATIPADRTGRAVLSARAAGVVAGLPAAMMTFREIDPELTFETHLPDGTAVQPGARLATVGGRQRSILAGEPYRPRACVGRLSGIATLTRRHVEAVAGLPCRILDTRKTTPGWRVLEKYAVRGGGGDNHRMGLDSAILIKDNHLAAIGTGPQAVTEAIRLARAAQGPEFPIEVEVDTLEQLDAAARREAGHRPVGQHEPRRATSSPRRAQRRRRPGVKSWRRRAASPWQRFGPSPRRASTASVSGR